jgi:hypothetical protein
MHAGRVWPFVVRFSLVTGYLVCLWLIIAFHLLSLVGILGASETPLKCDLVKHSLMVNHPNLVLLQETKLANINSFKSSSFLPGFLNSFLSLEAFSLPRILLNLNFFRLALRPIRSLHNSNQSSMPHAFGFQISMLLTWIMKGLASFKRLRN